MFGLTSPVRQAMAHNGDVVFEIQQDLEDDIARPSSSASRTLIETFMTVSPANPDEASNVRKLIEVNKLKTAERSITRSGSARSGAAGNYGRAPTDAR